MSFTYDTNYNRLLTMTDGIGTTSYGYLAVTNTQLSAGQLASVDGPLANDTITYTYDALGRVKSRAIDGVAQAVTYDALGRVTVVTNALGTFSNAYVGVTGRISTNAYPNGQQTAFSYYGSTNDFRLAEIQHSTLNSNLSTFQYTYDADGQIATWTQQADVQTPQVWVTEYDPVDQLLGVTVRSNTVAGAILKRYVYAYDKAGNRTSETVGTSSTSSVASAAHNKLNQLTSTTGGGAVRNHRTRGATNSKRFGAGMASRLRTISKGRLRQTEHPAPCPPPSVFLVNWERGWEFFTQHVRFAFSRGCDHSSYDAKVIHEAYRKVNAIYYVLRCRRISFPK